MWALSVTQGLTPHKRQLTEWQLLDPVSVAVSFSSMCRPPDGGKDSSPRSSEAEPWVKPTKSWRAPDGA